MVTFLFFVFYRTNAELYHTQTSPIGASNEKPNIIHKMKNYIIRLCLLLAVFAGSVNAVAKKTEAKKADFPSAPTAILFNQVFNDKGTYPDLVTRELLFSALTG